MPENTSTMSGAVDQIAAMSLLRVVFLVVGILAVLFYYSAVEGFFSSIDKVEIKGSPDIVTLDYIGADKYKQFGLVNNTVNPFAKDEQSQLTDVLKLTINNPSSENTTWIMDTGLHKAYEVTIYYLDTDGRLQPVYKDGRYLGEAPSYDSATIKTLIRLPKDQLVTVYLAFSGIKPMGAGIRFYSEFKAVQLNNYRHLILGLGLAVFSILGIINLAAFIAIQKKQYLFYFIQTCFVISVIVSREFIFSSEYLVANGLRYELSMLLLVVMILLASCFFCLYFFECSISRPLLFLSCFITMILLAIGVFFLIVNVTSILVFIYLLASVVFGSFLIYGGYAYLTGITTSLFFSLAWLATFFAAAIYPYFFYTKAEIAPMFFSGVVIACFSAASLLLFMALNAQYAKARRDNILSQQKLINKLSYRIKEVEEINTLQRRKNLELSNILESSRFISGVATKVVASIYQLKINYKLLQQKHHDDHSIDSIGQSIKYLEELTGLFSESEAPEMQRSNLVDLSVLFEDLCLRLRPLASKKGIQLRYRASAFLIKSSAILLTRILENLTNNAINSTNQGGVLIYARKREGCLVISVLDTGKGFDIEDLSHLQRSFVTNNKEENNYGLGLGIIMDLADSLGYELTVTSKSGRGTVFSIKIPNEQVVV